MTALLAAAAGPALAQQPEAPDEAATPGLGGIRSAEPEGGADDAAPAFVGSDPLFRFHFVIQDQMSYKDHPFFQMTGDSDFEDGNAGTGNSWTPGRATEGKGEDLVTSVLRVLPSFGFDMSRPIDFPFPRGISVGLDYLRITQTDVEAIDTSASSVSIPRVSMDSFYYFGVVRLFAFDPNTPGLNYFVGIGLGILSGAIEAKPNSSSSTETIQFAQAPVGLTRFGLEASGDSFGFRYEVSFVNADEVKLAKNPYSGQSSIKTIDFSAVLIRISVTYKL